MIPQVPISTLPTSLPAILILGNVDYRAIAESVLKDLKSEFPTSFAKDGFWRDLLALTDNVRTFHGDETIKRAWSDCYKAHKPVKSSIAIQSCHIMKVGPMQWIQTNFTFHTTDRPTRHCSGFLRIIPTEAKEWKIWILCTMLEEIDGHGNPDRLKPVANVNGHHETNGKPNEQPQILPYDAVVIGAGPAGLATAGRLKALGLNALTVEKNHEVGMNWTTRYQCLTMHTPKGRNVLPFNHKYPVDTPYFISREDMADSYKVFAKKYALNIWLSTTLISATWDEDTQLWTLNLKREGITVKLRTKHIVFCCGRYTIPYSPTYANRTSFKGTVLHSADYVSASALPNLGKEKKALVIGTANTAHDIAEDLISPGYKVTMIQRDRTAIVPVHFLSELFDPMYNDGVDAEIADRETMLPPMGVVRRMAMGFCAAKFAAGTDKELLDGLEERGFRVMREVDLMKQIFEKGGKHYVDIGASRKIMDGEIGVRSGVLPNEWVEGGLRFEDGSVEEADVVVFCTGFDNDSKRIVERFVGEEVAGRLQEVGGVDSEGEVRGLWVPSGGE